MLMIYNSVTRKKEAFKPIEPGKVNLYVCGVTVYDYCHIGHARTYVAFDVVTRYLKWRGYHVTHVRNITDIEDKIIKRAHENQEDYQAVVNRFTQAMYEDFARLDILPPDHDPRATDYIPQMITMIQQLITNGYAYVAENGDVYFEIRKFKKYGELAHRDIDQLESGARVEISEVKRDPLDFVLWKLAKPGEPFWESPWGAGRPGWHLECSVMSTSLLGNTFDIHGGGKDLIFPHHENEIAQSEGATQCHFVNTWMHAGYLQINKEKMSKSLGNFFTIREVLKNHHPETLRYFLMTSHYRSPLSYSEESLVQARYALQRFYTALRGLPIDDAPVDSEFEKKFAEAMDDDFNTPIAMSILFELTHEIQRLRDKDLQTAARLGALLRKLGGIIGVLQQDPDMFLQSGNQDLNVEKVEQLIAARNQARASKNWAEADKIRAELTAMSVVLEDKGEGTSWRYMVD
jgi:cysteinyl-tRNA synthetase